MKLRLLSATLLLASLALVGCGMNPAGPTGSSTSAQIQQPQSDLSSDHARRYALQDIVVCPE